MWKIEPNDEYLKRGKAFRKRWKREHDAVLDNLDTYFVALNDGANALQIKHGFIHSEGMGAIAIDERHHGKLKATRLYLYPDQETKILHVVTIGDKDSQDHDVKFCHQFISALREASHDKKDCEKCPGIGTSDIGERGGPEGSTGADPSPSGDQEADGTESG